MSPIATSFPPATQSDIIGILQQKQDRAVAILSSSPLVASLSASYAYSTLQGEIDELRSENLKMRMDLKAAAASLGAFRSQVVSLEKVNVAQQWEINSLREELLESKDKHSRLVEDSRVERDALRSTIFGLEVQRAELRKTIYQEQLKVSDLAYQCFVGLGREEWEQNERDIEELAERMERMEREAKEAKMAKLYAKQKARKEAREKAEQEARAKAQREARKMEERNWWKKMERWEERWEMEERKRLETEEREVREWREDRWERWEEKWERREEKRERRERREMERRERRER